MRPRFPILLLVYVTLDFTNPLMPGAVSFEAGSIEVVQADRTTRAARAASAPGRLVAAVPTWSVVVVDATFAPSAPPPALALSPARRTVRRAS